MRPVGTYGYAYQHRETWSMYVEITCSSRVEDEPSNGDHVLWHDMTRHGIPSDLCGYPKHCHQETSYTPTRESLHETPACCWVWCWPLTQSKIATSACSHQCCPYQSLSNQQYARSIVAQHWRGCKYNALLVRGRTAIQKQSLNRRLSYN